MMKNFLRIFVISLLLGTKIVVAAQMSDWGNYASSIQNCSTGSFDLPDPKQMNMSQLPLIINYKIIGRDAQGNCKVVISRKMTLPGEAQPRLLTLNCLYPKDKLGILSQAARKTAAGSVSLSSEEASNELTNTYCK